MAVTLTSTGVTFSNGTTQASGITIGAVQYTAYSNTPMAGWVNTTSQYNQVAAQNIEGYIETGGYNRSGIVNTGGTSSADGYTYTTTSLVGPSIATSLLCGYSSYINATRVTNSDSTVSDAPIIYRRTAYRSIS